MSDTIAKAQPIDRRLSSLTAADTFHGSRDSWVDEESGANDYAARSSSSPASTRSSKRRLGLFAAGTAAFLIVIGVAAGVSTRNNGSEAAGAGAPAAVPSAPETPTVEIASEDTSVIPEEEPIVEEPSEPSNFDPEPEIQVGDSALLTFPGVATPGTPPPTPAPFSAQVQSPTEPVVETAALVTSEPTKSPSKEPSTSPSQKPTPVPSGEPTSEPTARPTPGPSSEPTEQPTPAPTNEPTPQPTNPPTPQPTNPPTPQPSEQPTNTPTPKPTMPDLSGWASFNWNGDTPAPTTANPTSQPTPAPTSSPTEAPTPVGPFFFGDEFDVYDDLGIHVSKGLSVRVIAETGKKVPYANGGSGDSYHTRSDAAGIIPECPDTPTECGYAYVVNSEEGDGNGGVYAIYFDKDANVLEYDQLLSKTTDNCGGGMTPWHTFVSCEEWEDGQCWQIDAYNGGRAEETELGGSGGRFESVAVDNRRPLNPVFFTTEDHERGALRRFVADGNGWDSLHRDPAEEERFLNILDGNTFEWTTDEDKARDSAEKNYPKTEGIQFHEGKLHFMAKEMQKMFTLDLEAMTYTTEGTGKKFYGEGSFEEQPDQNMFGPTRKYMYFTEDGGLSAGVYARYHDGTYFTIFQAIKGGRYGEDETVGIAMDPSHKRLYAGIQDWGIIFEFTRDDGLAFE